MINNINIANFKCFEKKEINFKRLTVLSGSNSVGKTSVIQTILLAKIAIDRLNQLGFFPQNANFQEGIYIPLNGRFCLSLGNTKEVLTRDASSNIISFVLTNLENGSVGLYFKAEDTSEDHYELEFSKGFSLTKIPFHDLNSEFYYLNAERIGPRLSYDADQQDFPHVGYQGEYTIQILSQKKGDDIEVKEKKGFIGLSDYKLLNQVRAWMSYIIPDFYLDDAVLEGRLKKAHASFSKSSPTNVGFGISYVLPIIVNGLIAKQDCIFVVENPEAHLHPKGQSNIGFFLGVIASAGIQVIVETHSEHVVNGIRRAALSITDFNPSDIIVNFFEGIDENKNVKINEISVSETGDLTSFPRDFFDQVQQDMAELFKLQKQKK